ncbi:MAG: type VI secretion system membrane subunit TssM, partial [Betaproteobacteria bacterium]|nr:type VI secretion system membrane subunit TssM [Betaproteobacteria bacterium]
MKGVFKFVFNRWTMVFLGLVAVALLIWFIGPLIAIADHRPLESDTVRLILIASVFIFYAGKLAWGAIKAKKLNARLMEGLLHHPSPPAQPGAGAEEVAVLRKRFEEAVAVLKQADIGGRPKNPLVALLTRRQYVYELPWYIFIGPPGSGKTTALVNSGLQFPFAERFGQEMIRGIGGTRNCDWWFTNEAVLLDTAGRYTTQESSHEADSAAWTGFLQLLKKYRPRRPINGVIVTVSVADLLQQTQAQREAQANAIRKRIQELHEELNIRFPLYVLVTKIDLLAGFMEFFSEYGKEERGQVWGTTLPFAEKQNSPALDSFNTEFAALEQRLNDRLIDRLQQERDIQKRALLYTFLQQFHSLKEVLGSFLNQVFSPSRFEQQPLLRGFYFTSGTQEGNPIDRIMGGLARALQLDRKLLAPQKPSGKSFFLTRLIKDVVFSEAGLAGTNLRWERNRAALQWGMFAAAGLITAGAVAAWTISYSNNKEYVARVKQKLPATLEKVQSLPVRQTVDIVSLLPVLNSVKELADTPNGSDGVPLSMDFGLYQGEKLAAASNNAYQKLLQDAFLPQIVLRLERLLSTGSRANPELLYEGLKAYLMLYEPRHFDAGALKAFITADWEISLPREITVEQRRQLEIHLDNLLAHGPLSSPVPINAQLVSNVRYAVAQTPIAQRIYNRIKRQGVGAGIPEFTIPRVAGPSAPLIFTRASGQPLTKGVPGLFSYTGYHKAFSQAAREVTRELADEEVWVLDLKEKDRNRWMNPEAQARLLDEVHRLYLEDYASIWSAFINDIQVIHADNLQKSIQMARLLSASDSPLISLMRAIVKETTLVDVAESDKTIVGKTTDKVKSARNKLELLFGQTDQKAPAAAAESKPETIVDDRFKDLRNMVRSPAPGQPAPIDAIPAQINELYMLLTATEAAIKGGGAPPQSDVPTKIKADAGRMPEPVRSMLATLAAGGISQALGATRTNLDQALRASIGEFCTKATAGRYPFVKDSPRDVTPADFVRLFAPGGLLDEFFQKNLAQYVDTSTRPWRFRKIGDADMGRASGALQEFQRAQTIRDVFFPGGGPALGMDLTFKPIEMDASITQFVLNVDGNLVRYGHGPQQPTTLRWAPQASSQVRLQIAPDIAGSSVKIFEGPWALFRMLDGMEI